MVELILATYGLGCWLVFKKFKLVPINTSARIPVQVVGSSGAGADGFYTSLSLGSPTGAFPIDGWAVQ